MTMQGSINVERTARVSACSRWLKTTWKIAGLVYLALSTAATYPRSEWT